MVDDEFGCVIVPPDFDVYQILPSCARDLESPVGPRLSVVLILSKKAPHRVLPYCNAGPGVFDRFPVVKHMMHRRCGDLSGGQRQSVSVARSVKWAKNVFSMDEPTAALGVAQSQMVLDLMKEVRNSGIPVIYVSHNMPHVYEVADRIVVLRLGTVVTELDPKIDTIDQAVGWMTGSTSDSSHDGNRAA